MVSKKEKKKKYMNVYYLLGRNVLFYPLLMKNTETYPLHILNYCPEVFFTIRPDPFAKVLNVLSKNIKYYLEKVGQL